ncbi:ABC transporter ATP-binding protein [Desulfosporosinus sp. FKB]|uniref:ABC transporter ATP-binding protein n=1 Tax=Desulfosporosinus sp. FKB TaxID=1969835 RepID=UPI000B4986F3|nr:ABC transporter ATP-binding protein [Desulfosporosinus sp. FKB]
MKLEVCSAVCGYGRRDVIKGISFSVSSKEIFCLLGPNGVGKTTLFKTVLGFLKLRGGSINVDGEDISQWSRKKYAQVIGYVPQTHTPPFPFAVSDVVIMGRTAHLGSFSTPALEDRIIVRDVMEELGIMHLKDRIYTEISGGERQMVLIARALAQQPQFLVMDEPTSNLDFGNQMLVLRQIRKLSARGIGVIMTSHFPDHAFLCSSKVALLRKEGFEIGRPDEIVTEENLQEVYGVRVKITSTPVAGGLVKACVPLI